MFLVNWINYIDIAPPGDEHPCWVDFVGDVDNPALWYGFLTNDITDTDIAFRMQLNGLPLDNQDRLKNAVWGVQIKDISGNILYTARINTQGNNNVLQVIGPDYIENIPITLEIDVPILNQNPLANVVVSYAPSNFPCSNPNEDEDYYLDFKVPLDKFKVSGGGFFDFRNNTYRFCYFTSEDENNINKEYICGELFNPPEGVVPFINKTCPIGQLSNGDIATFTITYGNNGQTSATDVTVTDEIVIPAGVIATVISNGGSVIIGPGNGSILIGPTTATFILSNVTLLPNQAASFVIVLQINQAPNVAQNIQDTATIIVPDDGEPTVISSSCSTPVVLRQVVTAGRGLDWKDFC